MVYDILYLIYNHHTKKFIFSKENKALAHKIKSLNYEEKNILSIYINNKIQEKALNPNDSAVAWLESVKFIIYTGKIEGHKKIFRIDPTLAKYLQLNPNILY
jgi:predicted nucleotide-binding protein (sugar kinase/HSP70/actin superfamily)